MTDKQLMIFNECIKEEPYEYIKHVKHQFRDKNQEAKEEFLRNAYQLDNQAARIVAKNFNELLTGDSLR